MLRTTTKLIRAAEKSVIDPQGWAIDMHDVLQQHDFPQTKENICAAIAIIDQESGFVADPQVPGLGKLSETALREKFGKNSYRRSRRAEVVGKQPHPQCKFHGPYPQRQNRTRS